MKNYTEAKIIITQDRIDEYDHIAKEFMAKIFDMDFEDVLISDMSQLSDFSGSGFSHEQYNAVTDSVNLAHLEEQEQLQQTFNAINDSWDKFILEKINTRYGLDITSATILLLDLFEMIRKIDEE